MDRDEIRARARTVYDDELRYSLSRDDITDTEAVRERATMRLARDGGDELVYELWRGLVDGIAKTVERRIVVDLVDSQLILGGAIRTGDNTLCPSEKARARDWLAFDAIRERVWQEHTAKRGRERTAILEIVARLDAHGGDPTTLEACPDLFGDDEATAAP